MRHLLLPGSRLSLPGSGDERLPASTRLAISLSPPRRGANCPRRPGPCRLVPTVGKPPTKINKRTILGFHRRHNRRTSDYERRSRVPAPIPRGGRALPVVEAAPEREFLVSRPLLSEVWGCRREIVGPASIDSGVPAFLRKSPGTSIADPFQNRQTKNRKPHN